jgi:NADP-dependent 3-hydroxy acid dehydrogenase YdfG
MAVLVSEYVEAVVMNIYKTCCLVVQTVLLVGMLPFKIISSVFFPNTPKTFSSVFITGASSGIGAELAKQYASKGVRLTLTARRVDKLSKVKSQCEALGAIVHTVALDVMDKDAMREAICEADDKQPLDLAIANAGVAATTLLQKNDKVLSDVSSMVTEVNVIGVCNTLSPAIERMRSRKSGQLVINASITGLLGITGHPLMFAYSSSKVWACALRYGASKHT